MFTVMEKLDEMTPWHAIRAFLTYQEAAWAAMRWATDRRKPGEAFPKYEVNGRVF